MGGHEALEVAKTVLEVADVAWAAMECHHHLRYRNSQVIDEVNCSSDEELKSLQSENQRLRDLLEQNLRLIHKLSESPTFVNDCPPDLYARLVDTIRSDDYLARLECLQQERANGGNQFPFKEATEFDYESADFLINVDSEEPSWWVWVTDEMVPSNIEEKSGIDNENYVVISEEHVIDGVANFMARCILSNPKAQKLSPEELQKTLSKALGGVSKLEKVLGIWHAGKMFYALSTWGLALAGLYRSRTVLKLAAKGVHTTSKLALRAL